MILPALFHWSPTTNRESILRDGLKPYSAPVVHSGAESFPYICLSPTPSSAWGLSGDMGWVSTIEEWDLWQVWLREGDEVDIRGDFGPIIREVRVRNALPGDRVWYVATRQPLVAR